MNGDNTMYLRTSIYKHQAIALNAAVHQTRAGDVAKNPAGPISLDVPVFIDHHFTVHFTVRERRDLEDNVMMITLTYDDIPLAHGWSTQLDSFDFNGGTKEFHMLDVGGNDYTVVVTVADRLPVQLPDESINLCLSQEFLEQWDKINSLCHVANIADVEHTKVEGIATMDFAFYEERSDNSDAGADNNASIRFMVDRLNPLQYEKFEPYSITAIIVDDSVVVAKSLPYYIPIGSKPFDDLPMQIELRTLSTETVTPAAWQSSMKAVYGSDPYQYPSNIAIALTKKP